jgi:hypothetical protein
MTMQADLVPARFFAFSANDLRPDLIKRFRTGLANSPQALAWSALTDSDLLTQAGFLTHTHIGSSPEISAEGLLLFGTEKAIAEVFPFLETTFLLRKKERRLHESIRLPLNLIDCLESLRRYAHENVWPEIRTRTSDHASLQGLVLDLWIWEMAVSRDYAQVKPTRFGCDSELFFLEYPKIQPILEFDSTHTPPPATQNQHLTLGLRCLFPTMQAVDDATLLQWERDLFGMSPLRLNGRFFRISATYPPFLPVSAPANHASLIVDSSVLSVPPRTAPDPEARATMQAESPTHQPGRPKAPPPPLSRATHVKPTSASAAPSTDRTARILEFCHTPRHREEIQKLVGMNNRDHFRKEVLNKLIAQGLLRPTLPDKPNSPKQQYVAARAG